MFGKRLFYGNQFVNKKNCINIVNNSVSETILHLEMIVALILGVTVNKLLHLSLLSGVEEDHQESLCITVAVVANGSHLSHSQ
jgi:hypothetical protein